MEWSYSEIEEIMEWTDMDWRMAEQIAQNKEKAIRIRVAKFKKEKLKQKFQLREDMMIYLTDLIMKRWWQKMMIPQELSILVKPGICLSASMGVDMCDMEDMVEGSASARGKTVNWKLEIKIEPVEVTLAKQRENLGEFLADVLVKSMNDRILENDMNNLELLDDMETNENGCGPAPGNPMLATPNPSSNCGGEAFSI